MFREMRRFKQALTQEECVELLEKAPRGVLAVSGDNGYPYALPLDYIYLDGALYFHGARQGHKLDSIDRDSKVSFCVMDEGFHKEGDWALTIKSVIVFGRMARLDDRERALTIARRLGQKYYPTEQSVEDELSRDFDRLQLLELKIEYISGKRVHEA